jgi:hypothetical protein
MVRAIVAAISRLRAPPLRVERQPPWPVASTILAGGAERKTCMPVNGRVKVGQRAAQNVATLGLARLPHRRAAASGLPRLSRSWRLPGCFDPSGPNTCDVGVGSPCLVGPCSDRGGSCRRSSSGCLDSVSADPEARRPIGHAICEVIGAAENAKIATK